MPPHAPSWCTSASHPCSRLEPGSCSIASRTPRSPTRAPDGVSGSSGYGPSTCSPRVVSPPIAHCSCESPRTLGARFKAHATPSPTAWSERASTSLKRSPPPTTSSPPPSPRESARSTQSSRPSVSSSWPLPRSRTCCPRLRVPVSMGEDDDPQPRPGPRERGSAVCRGLLLSARRRSGRGLGSGHHQSHRPCLGDHDPGSGLGQGARHNHPEHPPAGHHHARFHHARFDHSRCHHAHQRRTARDGGADHDADDHDVYHPDSSDIHPVRRRRANHDSSFHYRRGGPQAEPPPTPVHRSAHPRHSGRTTGAGLPGVGNRSLAGLGTALDGLLDALPTRGLLPGLGHLGRVHRLGPSGAVEAQKPSKIEVNAGLSGARATMLGPGEQSRVGVAQHGAEEVRPMDSTPHPTIPQETAPGAALFVKRLFTSPDTHPFDTVEWELRDARIGHGDRVAFEQADVEFPKSWSQNATNIVAQKYFRGQIGHPARERSVKQMIGRVAGTIAGWGRERAYFATEEDAEAFEAELTHILLHQMAAFNSPVWFNVGFEESPQCSACFILSVEDTMESILEWNTKEGNIFRGGSGSGINLSNIRGSMEPLAKGGTASGPVSFMRGADSWAGTIKSGGKTRRAAKMVVLDVDHPDIREFIWCKAKEEDKAEALRDAGFDMSIDGDGFKSIQYQNANNSVRITDEFMRAVEADGEWHLTARSTGEPVGEPIRARELMREIAEAAWRCADPGVQYDTTINQWHTSPKSGRINASNPCSEYMHVDDSACNLASLNLMKFRRPDGTLDVESFEHTVDVMLLAQEIVVGPSSYPTEEIGVNARAFR